MPRGGGEFDCALITEPDRLARNYVQQMVAPRGVGARRLPRRVPRPPDEPGPARPAPAADPRRGGRVRADAHRRADAPGAASRSCAPGVLLPWTRPPYGYRLERRPAARPGAVYASTRPRRPSSRRSSPVPRAGSVRCCGWPSICRRAASRRRSGGARWERRRMRGILRNPPTPGSCTRGARIPARRAHRRSATASARPAARHGLPHCRRTSGSWSGGPRRREPGAHFDEVQTKLAQNRAFARAQQHGASVPAARAGQLRALRPVACAARALVRGGATATTSATARGAAHTHTRATSAPRATARPGQLDELVWARPLRGAGRSPEQHRRRRWRAPTAAHWLPQELQARREQLRRARQRLAQQLERLTDAYLGGGRPARRVSAPPTGSGAAPPRPGPARGAARGAVPSASAEVGGAGDRDCRFLPPDAGRAGRGHVSSRSANSSSCSSTASSSRMTRSRSATSSRRAPAASRSAFVICVQTISPSHRRSRQGTVKLRATRFGAGGWAGISHRRARTPTTVAAGEPGRAHQPRHPARAAAHAVRPRRRVDARRAVGPAAVPMAPGDLGGQRRIGLGAGRDPAARPGIVAGAGHAQHPAEDRDGIIGLLRLDDPVATHKVSFAK